MRRRWTFSLNSIHDVLLLLLSYIIFLDGKLERLKVELVIEIRLHAIFNQKICIFNVKLRNIKLMKNLIRFHFDLFHHYLFFSCFFRFKNLTSFIFYILPFQLKWKLKARDKFITHAWLRWKFICCTAD